MRPESSTPDEMAVECRTFSRFLADVEPSSEVVRNYARLLEQPAANPPRSELFVDRFLLAVGKQGSIPLRMADGYARVFARESALRRRLILLLAILENSPVGERTLNSGHEESLKLTGVRLAGTLTVSAICFALGVMLFFPVHAVAWVARTGRGRGP